ncbi:MAG: hypothetical protein GXY67_10520 [Clostridiales bacterium]|nr:hypothetical protein [Clostridiales bacterium]
MVLRNLACMPPAYTIEHGVSGLVNIWLCRQIDAYQTPEGQWRYDVDMRVLPGVHHTPDLEGDMRQRFESWWAEAVADGL